MSHLVEMEKGGERLAVHPNVLAAHEQLGWSVAKDRPKEQEAAPATVGKIELGTDSGDQFSDEQLRAIIEQETGEKVHHKTGREKLVARFNEINAAKAARQEETASNGLTRREIEADLEGAGIEFDPRDSVEDLLALRDMAREERGA